VIGKTREGGDADQAFPSDAPRSTMPRVLTPGDWVHIEQEGRTIVGMIDRLQEGLLTFAYWDGGVLMLGTAKPSQIGAWDEQLTAEFRAAIAIDPHYLARFIASWKEPDSGEPDRVRSKPIQGELRYVQKRLFPDER
jgi:hypothetical protein